MSVSIRLDENTQQRLKKLAKQRKRTPHWLMKEAIEDYIERAEKREAFRHEAMVSWEKYQKDGRHLSFDDVQNWLKNWGTNKSDSMPPCRD